MYKKNTIVFISLCAILLGLLYFLPNILLPKYAKDAGLENFNFFSLNAPTLDEVAAYGTRVKDVIDGNFKDGDPYLLEYSNKPTIWGSYYMSIPLGLVSYILRARTAQNIFYWSDLFFPVISFLILFILFRKITKHNSFSIFTSLVVIAFPNLSVLSKLFSLDFVKNISFINLWGIVSNVFDPSFSRMFVPSFSFIFFAGFLLNLYLLLSEPTKKRVLFTAFNFGILFYVYFYYWSYSTIVLGLLFLYFLIRRDWTKMWQIFFTGLIGLITSIPYWIKFFQLKNYQYYLDISNRVGLELGYAFRASGIGTYIKVVILMILIIFFSHLLSKKNTPIFLGALLLATIIVTNVQIVLGYNVQPDHWGSRLNVYIYTMSLLLFLFLFFSTIYHEKKSRKFFTISSILGIFSLFVIGFVYQVNAARATFSDYTIPNDVIESFNWIDKNIDQDKVFITPSSKTIFYLPFFTSARVYVPPACYTLAPREEIFNRFTEASRLFNFNENKFKNLLYSRVEIENPSLYFLRQVEIDPYYLLICADSNPGNFYDDVYNKFLEKIDVSVDSLSFNVDYAFCGPSEKLLGDCKKIENQELVFSNNSVNIYKINK